MSVTITDVSVEAGTTNLPVQVQNFPATQPVSGSVSVSNFPATQPVSGTVSATQGTSPWVISGSVTVGLASTATITRVATSTTAVQLLAANVNRKKLIITTETGTSNFVAFGSVATATNYTYLLGATATLEEQYWTGSVSLIRSSGTGNVQVTELV